MKHIVILGGSYAGISTAHRILKQVSKSSLLKITIVSPNTHFYWNMASPRGVLPGKVSDDQLFEPIAPGFEQYPKTQVQFIVGTAEDLNFETKQVNVATGSGNQTLSYDMLILATGSRTADGTPFKSLGTTEMTKNALHEFQASIEKSGTIVIAGGGVTGAEVAGELGFEYGRQKRIILISRGSSLLPDSPPSVSRLVLKKLLNLNVDVRLQTTISRSETMPNGLQDLTLSTKENLVADMFIAAHGLLPNSSYVPSKFLDPKGYVMVDEHLRVKGIEGAWAIGDVCNVEYSQFITCEKQSAYLAKSIMAILSKKTTLPYQVATRRFLGLQIGPKAGTGYFGSFKIPSFIIVMARKTLFVERLGPTVKGSLF